MRRWTLGPPLLKAPAGTLSVEPLLHRRQHYFRCGSDDMYLLQKDQILASVDQSWLLDALFVFAGDCTCCFRKHEGMKCDKPFVRDMMLGLYAQLFNFKKKDGVLGGVIGTGYGDVQDPNGYAH